MHCIYTVCIIDSAVRQGVCIRVYKIINAVQCKGGEVI